MSLDVSGKLGEAHIASTTSSTKSSACRSSHFVANSAVKMALLDVP